MGRSTRNSRRTVAVAAAFLACAVLAGCEPRSQSADELYTSATVALRKGELEQASALADRGLADAARALNAETAVRFRLLKAEVFLFRRDAAAARALLSVPFPDVGSLDRLRARRMYLEGQAHVTEGKLDAAEQALNTASQQAVAAASPEVEIDAKVLRGQSLLRMGRWDEADVVLADARSRAQAAGDAYREALAQHNLGMNQLVRSRFDAAVPYFEQVLADPALEEYTVHATALTNVAQGYARLGQFTRAVASLERAIALHERRGATRYLQQALGELGATHLLALEFSKGVPYLQRAITMAKELGLAADAALWASYLATAHLQLEQWDEATALNHEALTAAGDSRNAPYLILTDAKIAEGRGRLADASALYRKALEASTDESAQWPAYAGLARVDVASGRLPQGLRNFESALRTVERARAGLLKTDYKLSIQTRQIDLYQRYVDVLVGQQQFERALVVADSSRARVLAERHGVEAPGRAVPVALRRVAGQLDAVLLFYWVGPEQSYVWSVTADRIGFVPLPANAARLEALVREYQSSLVTALADPLAAGASPGDELYALLVAPVAKAIPGGSRVILVPDGPLNRLNFETLPVPGGRRHYWVEDVEIAVAPSLGTLTATAAASPRRDRSVLLVGDAVANEPRYPRLRHASAEIDAIAQAFPARASVYRADRATPASYLAAQPDQYDIVHFTAHAEANAESPLDSAVILSPDGSRYKLYARDVAEHALSAELVTISACRSAGDRTYAGEGLVGFAWAFLRAGARRVVAGLWDVDDRSTAVLMGDMYARVSTGTSPGAALRAAKLEMIRRGGATAKPYYWGPFQLFIGAHVVP